MTKKANPAAHQLKFSSLFQSVGESVNDFVVWLKSVSLVCEFSCPGCHKDLPTFHIKDQLICGLHNEQLKTDILVKTNQLTLLENIIKHVEAYESVQRNQPTLHKSGEASVAWGMGGKL